MGSRRSTKAGVGTPATRGEPVATGGGADPAQRRPGLAPRRHTPRRCRARALASTLNEGRGWHPGDTRSRPQRCCSGRRRSTKAGVGTPATRAAALRTGVRRRPLNEGRGWHPGDTRVEGAALECLVLRSTKAGVGTPATHIGGLLALLDDHAQRRPGLAPRRHPRPRVVQTAASMRSTKAGVGTPATPARELRPALLEAHRSTKAGVGTPATPSRGGADPRPRDALNEGRGWHPGDTVPRARRRRGGRRSTKAGVGTPATRPTSPTSGGASRPLNEGRGWHPGDTCSATESA